MIVTHGNGPQIGALAASGEATAGLLSDQTLDVDENCEGSVPDLAASAVAADAKESALSWQKQANDTRAAVVGVAEELATMNDEGKPDAKGLVDDAMQWLAKGDDTLGQADQKMASEDFASASTTYNMAWQYYVKAATAGLAAKTMLGGR